MSCGRVLGAASGKTPYVRFDLNDYSIPHTLVKKPLTLVAEEHAVRVLDGDTEVARHARSYDRGKVVEDARHIAQLARDKRRAHDLRGRDRLRSACRHADALLDALAVRNEHLGGHTTRLLQLLDRYGAVELDRAIAEALSRGSPSAASVAHLTTNLAFTDWPTVFPNAACTTALIDRVVHHAEIIAIEGESYRRREAQQAQAAKPSRRPKPKD